MRNQSNRVCPVEKAGSLDSKMRRWFQNPKKILKPFIENGMTVLDIGCGPGFFSIDMAEMVGTTGRVIAADLQQGMLQKVKDKINGTKFEDRITLHKCEENKIGVTENIDFVLAFYVLHELPDQAAFFTEISAILNPNGQVFIVEPPFHVSNSAFSKTISHAQNAELTLVGRPGRLFSKTALFRK